MNTVQISLNTIEKVKSFVKDISGFNSDIDLIQDRYVVDAKSIMGILSLVLSKPIDLKIYEKDEELDTILEALQPYIVPYID
jgi:phosphotransferase system HPr-like phosphotransfer protein